MSWKKAQRWESGWWGDCLNTFGEESKQMAYARRMGLRIFHNGKSPYNIDLQGRSVLDIGGGPVSLLLKCTNVGSVSSVIDPILDSVPEWVLDRYLSAGIEPIARKAEKLVSRYYDEAWIYNCLQHTEDPMLIIDNAKKVARIIRVFEWVETEINEGHPHSFTKEVLDNWLDGYGKVGIVNENTAKGKAYYGIFPT